MKERTVLLYCDNDIIKVQHFANQLENEGIETLVVGDTATTVLGIDNITQKTCIRVFQRDFVRAKALIDKLIEMSR